VKGAPDVLLARSTTYLDVDGSRSRWTPTIRVCSRRTTAGQRGHARARRRPQDFEPARSIPSDLLGLIQDLELLALIGIVDPPRKEARTPSRSARTPASGSG
jgi:Ca2+-transporting ATPase